MMDTDSDSFNTSNEQQYQQLSMGKDMESSIQPMQINDDEPDSTSIMEMTTTESLSKPISITMFGHQRQHNNSTDNENYTMMDNGVELNDALSMLATVSQLKKPMSTLQTTTTMSDMMISSNSTQAESVDTTKTSIIQPSAWDMLLQACDLVDTIQDTQESKSHSWSHFFIMPSIVSNIMGYLALQDLVRIRALYSIWDCNRRQRLQSITRLTLLRSDDLTSASTSQCKLPTSAQQLYELHCHFDQLPQSCKHRLLYSQSSLINHSNQLSTALQSVQHLELYGYDLSEIVDNLTDDLLFTWEHQLHTLILCSDSNASEPDTRPHRRVRYLPTYIDHRYNCAYNQLLRILGSRPSLCNRLHKLILLERKLEPPPFALFNFSHFTSLHTLYITVSDIFPLTRLLQELINLRELGVHYDAHWSTLSIQNTDNRKNISSQITLELLDPTQVDAQEHQTVVPIAPLQRLTFPELGMVRYSNNDNHDSYPPAMKQCSILYHICVNPLTVASLASLTHTCTYLNLSHHPVHSVCNGHNLIRLLSYIQQFHSLIELRLSYTSHLLEVWWHATPILESSYLQDVLDDQQLQDSPNKHSTTTTTLATSQHWRTMLNDEHYKKIQHKQQYPLPSLPSIRTLHLYCDVVPHQEMKPLLAQCFTGLRTLILDGVHQCCADLLQCTSKSTTTDHAHYLTRYPMAMCENILQQLQMYYDTTPSSQPFLATQFDVGYNGGQQQQQQHPKLHCQTSGEAYEEQMNKCIATFFYMIHHCGAHNIRKIAFLPNRINQRTQWIDHYLEREQQYCDQRMAKEANIDEHKDADDCILISDECNKRKEEVEKDEFLKNASIIAERPTFELDSLEIKYGFRVWSCREQKFDICLETI